MIIMKESNDIKYNEEHYGFCDHHYRTATGTEVKQMCLGENPVLCYFCNSLYTNV